MDERINDALSLLQDYTSQHVLLSAAALALGVATSLPLAVLSWRRPRLRGIVLAAASLVLCGLAEGSLTITVLLFLLCFAALGAGNGALFQLVPLRWPLTTAVAGSMIGEIGALGGGLIPNAMGLSKQYAGTYLWGFVLFAACAGAVLALLGWMQSRWTRTWAGRGGRAMA